VRRYKWLFDRKADTHGKRFRAPEYSLIVRPDFHKLKERIKNIKKASFLMVLGPTGDLNIPKLFFYSFFHGVGIGKSHNFNGIASDLREEGFNILYISHVASDFDEVREAVKLLTFDEHDDLIKGILDGKVRGKKGIENGLGAIEDEDELNDLLEEYQSLRIAVKQKDKSNTLALLNWVGSHPPKFDIIKILSDALI